MTRARKANLTAYDVVIIASMIDREAQVPAERPSSRRSSGTGCARTCSCRSTPPSSTPWARPSRCSPTTTSRSTRRTTPTSTPVCRRRRSPTRAWRRCRRPRTRRDVDYLYYVARNDGTGRHYFSTTTSSSSPTRRRPQRQRPVTARRRAARRGRSAAPRGQSKRATPGAPGAAAEGPSRSAGTTQRHRHHRRPGRAFALAGPPQRRLRGARARLRSTCRCPCARDEVGAAVEGLRGPRLSRRQRHHPAQGRGPPVSRPGRRTTRALAEAVNTIVVDDGDLRGYNTDVGRRPRRAGRRRRRHAARAPRR